MSGIATAMIAGSLVTGAVAYSANKSAKKAADTEIEFAQAQYEDWKEIYGPIEQNLASYYTNLSPDTFAAQGIQFAEEAYATAVERQQEVFAQRGINDSGISALVESNAQFDLARNKASIRQAAPQQVAQQQLDFLSVGQGNNPTSNYQQVLNANTNRTADASANASAAFGSSLASTVNMGLQAWGSRPTSAPTGTSGTAVGGVPATGMANPYDQGVYHG
jgi:anti-sigma-K factor RskA